MPLWSLRWRCMCSLREEDGGQEQMAGRPGNTIPLIPEPRTAINPGLTPSHYFITRFKVATDEQARPSSFTLKLPVDY